MCNDQKMLKQQLKNSKKAKYEMGNFYEQYGLPPLPLLGKNGIRDKIRPTKIINIKDIKDVLLKLVNFMIKRKMSIRNMISRNMVKEIVSIVGNLVTLVKTANKNLVN